MLIRIRGLVSMLEYIMLKNFLSHEDTEILLSEGINVFIGRNGAGKSSVIDGITYALYGKHDRGNNQNIVRNGFNEGFVVVKFSANGRSYEVYRAFNSKGGLRTVNIKEDGKMLVAGDRSKDESGVIREIESILGLDYDDITIATIIKQGELDAIIDLKPREIKELINRLIELDKLDKAYQEFRDVLDAFKTRLRKEYGYGIEDLELIDKELDTSRKKEEELQRSLKEIEEELKKEEEKSAKIEDDINEQKELKSKNDQYRDKREELYRYLRRKKSEYERDYRENLDIINKSYEYLDVIKEKKEIEERHDKLLELEKASNNFKQLNAQRNGLLESKKIYEQRINDVKMEIEKHESLIEPEYSYDKINEMLDDAEVELAENNRKIGEIQAKLDDYKKIKAEGICPTCDRESSDISIERKIREKSEELETAENKVKELDHKIKELKDLRDKRRDYDDSRESLDKLYKDLKELEINYTNILNQCNNIDEEIIQLGEVRFDAKEKRMLEDKIKIIYQAEVWLEAHKIKNIDDIKRLEEENNILKNKVELLEETDKVSIDMLAIDDYSRELINNINMLEEESKGYDPNKYKSLSDQLELIKKKIRTLISDQGGLQNELNGIHKKIKELDNTKRVLEQASRYMIFYERIREDIYHRRLPSELRSWAFNYISEKASEYLRIFDIDISNIHLREERNNIKMKGYRASEQVDIDSLSGGEKIAVSLALRFAIASFKSNNNVDFIILDEPTTHLDQERRRELVKLIGKLAGYQGLLRQIIMITHDAEIFEDADLDNIIRFEKRGGISTIER